MKLLFLIPIILLAACNSDTNPLENENPGEIAAVIYDNVRVPSNCAKIWGNPESSNIESIRMCEPEAASVAQALNNNGYDNISSSNVKLPAIWTEFLNLKETKKSQQKSDLKSMFKLNSDAAQKAKSDQELRRKQTEEYMKKN